ncbi:MAG: glycosyl hydrolase, partial [Flavobacterium sp.]|nr:glycosyl hydrolase [Flavobacterium sp.]
MSFRKDYILYSKNNESANGAFSSGLNFSNTSPEIISSLFSQELKIGMHGLCFSLYEDGQNPGDIISEEQVRRRMEIIAPYTKWVRSFSCTEGNEFIPKIAKEYGIKTLVGAWLGNNPE